MEVGVVEAREVEGGEKGEPEEEVREKRERRVGNGEGGSEAVGDGEELGREKRERLKVTMGFQEFQYQFPALVG